MAEILRNDEVGIEPQQQIRIQRVNIFAATDQFPHLPVDFRGKGRGIHSRPNERRLCGRFRRKIAFVRNAHDGIACADGVEDFGGGRKQRDNAHGSEV